MRKRIIYKIGEVFTPSQPARINYIERKHVNKLINRALNLSGKQIIIYGYSGAGKTTILANTLRERSIKYIKTQCITGMTIHDIVIDAFNQLEVFYANNQESVKSNKIGGTIGASYFGLKSILSTEISSNKKISSKRAVELPITPQNLAKYIGLSNNIWVLEDFHKIDETEKKQMSQIMKVFMDMSVEFPNLKIIAIGAVNSAREVVNFDPEMKNRISEIEVPLMQIEQLLGIISTGERLLNLEFDEKISKRIVTYSSGLPAVTHQLAYLLCEENGITQTHNSIKAHEIDPRTFDSVLNEYINENSDTLKAIFEKSTLTNRKRKSDNPIDILKAIIDLNKEEFKVVEVAEQIRIKDKGYKAVSLKKYLEELTKTSREEVLRYNKDSNTYHFSTPLVKAYFQCVFKSNVDHHFATTKLIREELQKNLKKELDMAREVFLKDYDPYEDTEDLLIRVDY